MKYPPMLRQQDFAIGIARPLQGAGHLLARPPGYFSFLRRPHRSACRATCADARQNEFPKIAYLLLTSRNYFREFIFEI